MSPVTLDIYHYIRVGISVYESLWGAKGNNIRAKGNKPDTRQTIVGCLVWFWFVCSVDNSYTASAVYPHRFRVWLPSADAADLEAVMAHALRRGSLLTYAFNFGRVPEPDWLLNMHGRRLNRGRDMAMGGTPITHLRTTVRCGLRQT